MEIEFVGDRFLDRNESQTLVLQEKIIRGKTFDQVQSFLELQKFLDNITGPYSYTITFSDGTQFNQHSYETFLMEGGRKRPYQLTLFLYLNKSKL